MDIQENQKISFFWQVSQQDSSVIQPITWSLNNLSSPSYN